jgi:ubiquinol-cytochrome c reductase cytochrome b subunit
MILTAFLGYVLPWGQMSFWAATVITNLASAIPFVGNKIVFWLWGGFAVDNATLNRFFSLHYLLPFVIAALAILHIVFLHEHGSSSPTGLPPKIDNVSFSPYFIVKDLFGFWIFFALFFVFVFFYPNVLGHTDNYIPANPLVTPTHIVPEWYFLPFYAILRSIPDKLMGVVSLLNSILVLLIVPFVFQNDKLNKGFLHSFYHKFFFWFFFFNCLVLGWIGGKSIETPYYEIGQIATVFYFLYFFLLVFFDLINNREFLLLNKFSFFHSSIINGQYNTLLYSFIYFLNLIFGLSVISFKNFYRFHFLGSKTTLYDQIFKS